MIWRGAAVILVVLMLPPLTAVALESFGDDAKGSPAPGANFDPADQPLRFKPVQVNREQPIRQICAFDFDAVSKHKRPAELTRRDPAI